MTVPQNIGNQYTSRLCFFFFNLSSVLSYDYSLCEVGRIQVQLKIPTHNEKGF